MLVEEQRPVTPDEAEDMLIAAIEYLSAMPDKERGWLAPGQGLRSTSWPAIIRDLQADYADGEATPRLQLSRKQVGVVEDMLTGELAHALAVPVGHRQLVGRVLVMKRWPGAAGFGWERIWEMEGGRRSGSTTDSLRMRYERALSKVAVAMERRRRRVANP